MPRSLKLSLLGIRTGGVGEYMILFLIFLSIIDAPPSSVPEKAFLFEIVANRRNGIDVDKYV
jgi:hypothetical protein